MFQIAILLIIPKTLLSLPVQSRQETGKKVGSDSLGSLKHPLPKLDVTFSRMSCSPVTAPTHVQPAQPGGLLWYHLELNHKRIKDKVSLFILGNGSS